MKIQRNWWIWLGLGLFFLIAFKFLNREDFVRSPIFPSGNRDVDTKITDKLRAIAVYLGYDKKEGDRSLDLFRSEKAMYIYQAQTKRISIDEFVSQITRGEKTEFSKLPDDSSKKQIHIMYEYLYNQPEQTQPLSFVRIV